MALRISTNSRYTRFLYGLRLSEAKLARVQEQAALARRIVRPSDDPTGTATALSLKRRIAESDRFLASMSSGVNQVDLAASNLQDGASSLAEARETLLQGMNGTLSPEDRASLAVEIDLIRTQLLEIANSKLSERHLFGGTRTDREPFVETTSGGRRRVLYAGNAEEQQVRIGTRAEVSLNMAGDSVFAREQRSGTIFSGLTGVASGATADQGTGNHYVEFRHDSTDLGSLFADIGVTSAGGAEPDTLLGSQSLVIDAVARTARLGSGEAIPLPPAGSAELAQVVLTNEKGGKLVLDFSNWSGSAWSAQVSGAGSVRLDGGDWQALDTSVAELRLSDATGATVLHLDPTGVRRAGSEMVSFGGTVNAFDALQAVSDDLRNLDGLNPSELLERLEMSLVELDRNHQNLLTGMGVLGNRSARLTASESRIEGVKLQLEGLVANVVEADYSELATQISQTELTLQMVQATAARINQSSLLNFLR